MQAGKGEDSQKRVLRQHPITQDRTASEIKCAWTEWPVSAFPWSLRRMLLGAKADDKEDASAKVLTHVSEDLTQLSNRNLLPLLCDIALSSMGCRE